MVPLLLFSAAARLVCLLLIVDESKSGKPRVKMRRRKEEKNTEGLNHRRFGVGVDGHRCTPFGGSFWTGRRGSEFPSQSADCGFSKTPWKTSKAGSAGLLAVSHVMPRTQNDINCGKLWPNPRWTRDRPSWRRLDCFHCFHSSAPLLLPSSRTPISPSCTVSLSLSQRCPGLPWPGHLEPRTEPYG